MGKEYLEALEHIYYGSQGYGETDKYYKFLKNFLEAIDNANPSEALRNLECLKSHISARDMLGETNKKIALDICNDVKQALLKQQQPKKYLKWEGLEFKKKGQGMKVLLNGKEYTLFYGLDVDTTWVELVSIENYRIVFTLNDECKHYKNFFNDLHLERVEE